MPHLVYLRQFVRSALSTDGKHKLRSVRVREGMTQRKLALEADVSASTISNIECRRGPDVPHSKRLPTKTKVETAAKLLVALQELPPGEYDFDKIVRAQRRRRVIFTDAEFYENPVNVRKRELARKRRPRHLKAVA